jgi:hypothetical protein
MLVCLRHSPLNGEVKGVSAEAPFVVVTERLI